MLNKLLSRFAHTRPMQSLGIANSADFWRVFRQFLGFGIVGVSNTLLSLFVYYIFKWLGVHYLLANIAGVVVGILNSFFWNSRFIFKTKSENSTQKKTIFAKTATFYRMCVSYGLTALLSTLLLYVWVQLLGISDNIAPIINLCITVPLNFLLNKLWVFKDK